MILPTSRPTRSKKRFFLAAAAVFILLVTAWTVQREFTRRRASAALQVEAVSELRSTQVQAWLDRQLGVARYMADSFGEAALYQRWQDAGDSEAGAQLLQRATASRRANDADRALLVRADGDVLAREFPSEQPESPELRATVERAIRGGVVAFSNFYRVPGDRQPLRMDVVVPLLRTGSPARGALVLRVSPERSLFPLLMSWPVPSSTAESILWNTAGGQVVNLSDVRFPPSRDRMSSTVTGGRWAVSIAARGEVPDGRASVGLDYRDQRVMFVSRAVPGTDWRLVSKLDMTEIDAASWRAARGATAVAALALLGVALAGGMWQQRKVIASGIETQREQQQRLQALGLLEAIAESASDSITAKDLEGRYVFCNREALRRIVRTSEEVIGARTADLFAADVAARIAENESIVMASRRARIFEEKLPTPGGPIDVLVSRGPMFDNEGRLIGVLGVSRDVTEARRIRRALDDSEARYRSVFSVLHEGIFVCDPQGRVISCNPAAERIIGVPVERWTDLYTPPGWMILRVDGSSMTAEELPVARVLAGEAALSATMYRAIGPDGGEAFRIFEVSAAPVVGADSGETIAVVTSFTDVTQREHEREELERHRHQLSEMVAERTVELEDANAALARSRDEAESATRAKSAFLANMSHEIRTPMNAIIGMTHLLSRQTRDPSQHDRLGKIDAAAQHLLHIINNVLDLSKIEAGRLQLEELPFALDDLMSRSIEMVADRAADKRLTLTTDTADAPTQLRGDATRLSQMLINLLSNAVEFTASGGIRIEVAPEPGDPRAGDTVRLRFSVHDTGEGISVERQAALFNAFEQADSSMTRRHGGTGLGLALTRQLAEAMGGATGLTSRLGAGSTFWFTVVLGRVENAAARGPRVLVADDDAETRGSIAAGLEAIGVAVDAVGLADVARVVAAAQSEGRPHDALLVDAGVDQDGGTEGDPPGMALLSELTRTAGGALPPAILMTSSQALDVWASARNVGFASVLPKPALPAAVEAALESAIGRPLRAPADVDAAVSAARPASARAVVAPDNAVLLHQRHRGQRVLLAEDNAVNREVAEAMLRGVGLVVETACDGAEALRAATSRPYHLVLMDMQMPNLDGLEATRRLRQRIGNALPVIAMTANAFSEDRAACLAAGMDDHIAKPVVPAQLYGVLLRWLPLRASQDVPAQEVEAVAEPPVAGSAVELDGLVARLRSLTDLDVEQAIDNLGGRPDILPRVLGRFVETYRDGDPLLREVASPNHRDGWRNACHSMRGAGATVGAMAMAEEARLLELDIDSGVASDVLKPRAAALDAAVKALSAQIEARLA